MRATAAARAAIGSALDPIARTRAITYARHVVPENWCVTGVVDELSDLLRRCASADRSAFRQLYDRMSPALYGVALRLTREPGLAADVVHDTFVLVWRDAAKFDPSRGLATNWLRALVRNRAIDVRRRGARELVDGFADAFEPVDDGPSALDRVLLREESRALRDCMDALSPDQRRALGSTFFDGVTHAELSEQLSVPIGTVHSWIRRAIGALRRCLDANPVA